MRWSGPYSGRHRLPVGVVGSESDSSPLSRRLAGSAMTLAGRRVLITAMSAVGTAIVARLVGVADFGQLSSALAASFLAAAASDFGFSLVLSRDLATDVAARGRLLRAGVHVQVAWSLVPTAAWPSWPSRVA